MDTGYRGNGWTQASDRAAAGTCNVKYLTQSPPFPHLLTLPPRDGASLPVLCVPNGQVCTHSKTNRHVHTGILGDDIGSRLTSNQQCVDLIESSRAIVFLLKLALRSISTRTVIASSRPLERYIFKTNVPLGTT